MSVLDHRVHLEAFDGPLDLLLFLIRKNEVDIHDIPMAKVTEQYLAAIKAEAGIQRLDIETAGEFLVMAATLMEIKSRMLSPLPKPEAGTTPDATRNAELDPRADLVQQLMAHKRFRDAALLLERRRSEWEARLPTAPAGVPEVPQAEIDEDQPVELQEIEIIDLVEAFARIMATVDFSRVGEHRVADDETPIELHQADLLDIVTRAAAMFHARAAASDGAEPASAGRRPGIELREVFAGRTKAEAVGLFLAMLELIRLRKIDVRQDGVRDRIWVEPVEEQMSPGAPGGGTRVTVQDLASAPSNYPPR
jgi:segregation and condensation protein A